MYTSSTLLRVHEGKNGSFTKWLEELGLDGFLRRFPIATLIEWGWLKPQHRIIFSEDFFNFWKEYPYPKKSMQHNHDSVDLLWQHRWNIESDNEKYWFIDPILNPCSNLGKLFNQNIETDINSSTPQEIHLSNGEKIIPHVDYFYRWQGYALIDTIISADCFEPILLTPELKNTIDAKCNFIKSFDPIKKPPIKWDALGETFQHLCYFRSFRNAVFCTSNSDAEKRILYKSGAKALADYFSITEAHLSKSITDHFLTLASCWAPLSHPKLKSHVWTQAAWPHLQEDIGLAVDWLILLSERDPNLVLEGFRNHTFMNRGWMELDDALPYEFIKHQNKFNQLAPIYLADYIEENNHLGALTTINISEISKTLQKENSSFTGFLKAFFELHEELTSTSRNKSLIDFRERRPLDHYALLAIHAEGCFRRKLDQLKLLDSIKKNNQSLHSYIIKLAEHKKFPKKIIDLFTSHKRNTHLSETPEEPIKIIESLGASLENKERQIFHAMMCCSLARNYFAHHYYLEKRLLNDPQSKLMLKGILITVLELIG